MLFLKKQNKTKKLKISKQMRVKTLACKITYRYKAVCYFVSFSILLHVLSVYFKKEKHLFIIKTFKNVK